MLILIAIILGFLIGKVRKGGLRGFKARKISLLPLGIIGFLLQMMLHFYNYTGGIPAIQPYLEIVNFASYILVLMMLVFNLDDLWVILMAIGLTANFVVIFINGGHMPVAQGIVDLLPTAFAQSIAQGTNAIYSLIQPTTLVWFLGINLPIPIPFVPTIMSLYGTVAGISAGTVIGMIGLIGFIQYVMNKKGSIMIDPSMQYDDDEGIFGEGETEGLEGVSIIQSDYNETTVISGSSIESIYQDLAGGAVRGEREAEKTTALDKQKMFVGESVTLVTQETKAKIATAPIPKEAMTTMTLPTVSEISEKSPTTFVKTVPENQTIILPKNVPEFKGHAVSEIGTETEEIIVPEQRFSDNEETKILVPLGDGSTKVLGSIQEVGTFVSASEGKSLQASEMEEIVNSEDTGFFTKKYYEEKLAIEKERLMAQVKEMAIEEEIRPAPQPIPESDLRIVESFKLTDLDAPFTLQNGRAKEKDEAPEVEEPEEFSEGEMMNVWQRINQEDAKKREVRRQQTIKQTTTEAESLLKGSPYEDETAIPFKEIEDVSENLVGKVYDSSNKERVIKGMDEEQRKNFNATLEERKKAGYDLVELQLDGKDVAFWRKKK